MANTQIQTYANMVNFQVASEAFLTKIRLGESMGGVLKNGNKNNSKEPNAVADLFDPQKDGNPVAGARYKLVAHQDLSLNATTISELGTAAVRNKSGFSASVFLDTATGQYTLSIRSTEFADNIKDLGDTRADGVEIFDDGWAFGQINSLETFWSSLKSGNAANGVNAVTIPSSADLNAFLATVNAGGKINLTGYSLGGNIAEAFTELHRAEVNQAYLFNGAGTGNPLGGRTFAGVWAQYKAVYDNPYSKYPATGVVIFLNP